MKASAPQAGETPSLLIDGRIKELGDWRGELLSRLRALIKDADPEVVEEWKWRGVPVWEHAGIICTGETYKSVVKLTFARGRLARRSDRPFQFQPRRQHPPRDRLQSGRQDQREGIQGADPRRGHVEYGQGK